MNNSTTAGGHHLTACKTTEGSATSTQIDKILILIGKQLDGILIL
jgi:hypothetical protein